MLVISVLCLANCGTPHNSEVSEASQTVLDFCTFFFYRTVRAGSSAGYQVVVSEPGYSVSIGIPCTFLKYILLNFFFIRFVVYSSTGLT